MKMSLSRTFPYNTQRYETQNLNLKLYRNIFAHIRRNTGPHFVPYRNYYHNKNMLQTDSLANCSLKFSQITKLHFSHPATKCKHETLFRINFQFWFSPKRKQREIFCRHKLVSSFFPPFKTFPSLCRAAEGLGQVVVVVQTL